MKIRRMAERVLSILLSVILVAGLLPGRAIAEQEAPAEISYQGKTYALAGEDLYVDSYTLGTGYIFAANNSGVYTAIGVDADGSAFTSVALAESEGVLATEETLAVFKPEFEEGNSSITNSHRTKVNGSKYVTFDGSDALALTEDPNEASWMWVGDGSGTAAGGHSVTFVSSGGSEWHSLYSSDAGWKVKTGTGTDFYVYQEVCGHEARVSHPASPATCTARGNRAYFTCPDCGSYLDESLERTYENSYGYVNTYRAESFTVNALGHHFVDGVCTHDGSHKAREYTPVTDASMLSTDAKYRYVIVNEDDRVLSLDHTGEYLELAETGASLDGAGKLTLDNSADADGVFAAEFRLSVFTPEDEGMALPEDGSALYTLFTDGSYTILALGSLWASYEADENAKYPLGISPSSDGIAAIRAWEYGVWCDPIAYSESESCFALGSTSNVRLYRGELAEEASEPGESGEGGEGGSDLPEYLISGGETYRLNRTGSYYGNGEENDPLQKFAIVARSGGSFYALNEDGGAAVTSSLEYTDGKLYGDAAIVEIVSYDGIYLGDGREMTLDILNADTGEAAFGFGTQGGTGNHEWRDLPEDGYAHSFVHYYYEDGSQYGDAVWYLLFKDGHFTLSGRTSINNERPDGWVFYVYQRECTHENKTLFEGREPDCLSYGCRTYYKCADCGLMLDEDLHIHTKRINWDDTEIDSYFEFGDFYTCPALGHSYDPASGICSRCGETAPEYEKITSVKQLISGRRYLMINDETGEVLDFARPVATGGEYDIPELPGQPCGSTLLENGRRIVYGTGGAAFYLEGAPAEETELPEDEESWDGYPAREYVADVEGHFAFIPDYSWEYPRPIAFGDKTFYLYEMNEELDGIEDDEERETRIEQFHDEMRMNWGLTICFLNNGDAGIRYFDGMHPITYDADLDYRFTLREEWIYSEEYEMDGQGNYNYDACIRTEIPTGVSLWREAAGPKAEFEDASVAIGEDLTLFVDVSVDESIEQPVIHFTGAGQDTYAAGTNENGVWSFEFPGIYSQYMSDIITMEVMDGDEVAETTTYSIRQYFDDLHSQSAEALGYSEEKYNAMITLLADTLEFGTMAQQYLGYNTDDPANALSWVGESKTGSFAVPESDLSIVDAAAGSDRIKAAALVISNYVQLRFRVSAENADRLTVTDNFGNAHIYMLADAAREGDDCLVYGEGLQATQYDTVWTVTLTDADGNIYHRITYSVNTYVASKHDSANEKLSNLVKALYNYGRSADNFNSIG